MMTSLWSFNMFGVRYFCEFSSEQKTLLRVFDLQDDLSQLVDIYLD